MQKNVCVLALGKKALVTLQGLTKDQRRYLTTVIVGRDKKVQCDYSDEIISFCKAHSISCRERSSEVPIREAVLIAVGWRWLVPHKQDQPVIVLHDSILPRYRGFNPLVSALINGDSEIGVTAILGVESFDKGDILDVEKFAISYPLKIEQAIELVSSGYSNICSRLFDRIQHDDLKGITQDESRASYSLWRDEEDYYVDWNWGADRIKRFVDAVGFPYGGARTRTKEKEILLEEVSLVSDVVIENRAPGKILFQENGCPTVVCGRGLLRLDSLKDPITMETYVLEKFRVRFR